LKKEKKTFLKGMIHFFLFVEEMKEK